ncbi:IQ and ubiquitin-like domain-containing protein, partial [Frankliniella fusca]
TPRSCDKLVGGAQVPRPDLYIPGLAAEAGRTLTGDAGRYVSADELLARRRALDAGARAIQRCYRAYLQRRRGRQERQEEEQREQEEGGEEEDDEERRSRELALAASAPSRYPRSRKDFDTLRALVERWRQAETRRLRASYSEAARRAMLGEVLEREMTLLNAIERHRQAVAAERARERERRFLERCAEPLVFEGSNGEHIRVETLEVARAKELQAAYARLTQEAPQAERLPFLLALMESLAELPLERAQELRRLLGRECTMMARGMASAAALAPLRRHISLLFAELVKCPEVNPEAGRHLRASQVARAADNAACTECRGFRPLDAFPLHSNSRAAGRCAACVALQNEGCARADLRPVLYMMAAVRRAEQRARAYSSVAFIMQPADFKVLLDLWLGRSALTEAVGDEGHGQDQGLWGLRLPRWRAHLDWSPWNCVLLTAAQARAHARLALDPEEVYAPRLVAAVVRRHLQARRLFDRLLRSGRALRAEAENTPLLETAASAELAPPAQ